jgi:hypothetical protein
MEMTMKDFEEIIMLMTSFSFLGAFIGVLFYHFSVSFALYLCDFIPASKNSIKKFCDKIQSLEDENFALSQELEIMKADKHFDGRS